ncbi:MAG: hypothetical protein LBN05_08005, partial [Oscillospiraceae bacterium]|nr:hypothetical protein [Oscillospiraceae bacterium]
MRCKNLGTRRCFASIFVWLSSGNIDNFRATCYNLQRWHCQAAAAGFLPPVKEVMRMNEIIAMALFLVCATGYML